MTQKLELLTDALKRGFSEWETAPTIKAELLNRDGVTTAKRDGYPGWYSFLVEIEGGGMIRVTFRADALVSGSITDVTVSPPREEADGHGNAT